MTMTAAIDEGELRVAGMRHMPARLLLYLAANAGHAIARDVIYRDVWEQEPIGDLRTLDVHITRLRKWLGDNPGHGEIVTYRQFGYRYIEEGKRR